MRRRTPARSGFTFVEAMISLAILGVMGVAFTSSMRSMANLTHAGNARSNVQREGARALEMVLDDLRRSAFMELGGLEYPHLFEDGDPGVGFDLHKHAVPPGEADAGDYDFNGVVNSSDYVIWRNNVGTTVAPYTSADGNGDGNIDSADYSLWRAHYGESIPGAGSGSAVGGAAIGTGSFVYETPTPQPAMAPVTALAASGAALVEIYEIP
jgi:type II secretory pathway pseudopilin PulG